ncbi:uncharacterized protein B0I36DRAFT_400054, partial [Microdochium trichocladiopsis]
AIVLVGSDVDAQATPCEKYLLQTWPSTGQDTMQCFVECLCSNVSRVDFSQFPDSSLELRIEDRKLVGKIHGTKSLVCDICEQLAWLGAALRENPNSSEALCFSEPMIQTSDPASEARNLPHNVTYSFQVNYLFRDFDPDTKPTYGQCWHGLFRNAVVAPGYPIPERSEYDRRGLGLEITLPMMASLTKAQFLNSFHKTPMIKSFSSLLYPTRQEHNSMTWHLIYNVDAKYMSFARGLSCFAPSFDLRRLQTGHRHFLGWCRDARLFAEALDAEYSVKYSLLPEVNEDCLLYGAIVERGRLVGVEPFQIGTKDTPAHLSRSDQDEHRRRLQWLHSQKVTFWDEEEKTGWLVDGVSALLHLLRAWIEHVRASDFGPYFLLKPECFVEAKVPYTTKSAVDLLMHEENLKLQLYHNEKTTLKDQLNRFCNHLEQMIAYHDANSHPCASAHAERTDNLEGWEFSQFVEEQDPLRPSFATLPVEGRQLADFQRSTGGVVFLGRGFGRLIQRPEPPQSHDSDGMGSSCPSFQVPQHSYYLTALASDVQDLGRTLYIKTETYTIPTGRCLSLVAVHISDERQSGRSHGA